MSLHPLAGLPVPPERIPNIPRLVSDYYVRQPDLNQPEQRVSFGTSGHRGSASDSRFNEAHILAIVQAVCEYRDTQGIDGPLMLGMDTHALSEAAWISAVEVLIANGVTVQAQAGRRPSPTPFISRAIIDWNRRESAKADGIIITPSHNPPEDGGLKYNPPHGGPAGSEVTRWIQDRANTLLQSDLEDLNRMPIARALRNELYQEVDFLGPYVTALSEVLNMDAIASSGLKLGVDPLGGASLDAWGPIADHYNLDLRNVNPALDASFSFMHIDSDGKIRMDCSSPYAMKGLISLKDEFDVAFGCDPDADRHGIVTRSSGLLNPNHYLAVAIGYLFQERPDWPADAAIGKTLVSSSMIDRVASSIGRKLAEVPVGFKWFVPGLRDGSFGFGGEESAGASFLRKDGSAWTTDKDGLLLCLLAAEICAVRGKDPGELYQDLTQEFGTPHYGRANAAASAEQRKALSSLNADDVTSAELAGEAITAKLTHAPGNGAAIGGLKVCTENGWFAARPSGTEDIYKIYAESFKSPDHLKQLQQEAQELVSSVIG